MVIFEDIKKKQKRLALAFSLIVLLILVVLWQAGFLFEQRYLPEEVYRPQAPQVKLHVLEDPVWEELEEFEKIAPFEEEIGKDNPFIPR